MTGRRHDEPEMTIERTPSGILIVSGGGVTFFVGECDEGCRWYLEPDYRSVEMVAKHSTNPEALLRLGHPDPFDGEALLDRIEAWVERCHEYEVQR